MNDHQIVALCVLSVAMLLYFGPRFTDWYLRRHHTPMWLHECHKDYPKVAVVAVCEITRMGYHTTRLKHGGIGVTLGNSFGDHLATEEDAKRVRAALQPLAKSGWEIAAPRQWSFDPGIVIMSADPPSANPPS